ncbi:MAG TPA: hypothetical protein VGM92_11655 [Candidatus Kapabacteria bacterium]|jgi:hypothetical protein
MPLYQTKVKDGLTDAVDRLRSELSVINEELRVIEMRKPALESRAQRISEALQTLIGDGSTGDPRWLQMPRIGEGGLERDEQPTHSHYTEAPHQRVGRPKHQIGPVKKPEITEDAIISMAEYSEKVGRPLKSAELYEHLVGAGLLEPIETEMPYKSFAITLRNIAQDFIEYDRGTKTWSPKDRSPRAKLREALEKGDGTRVVSSNSMGVSRDEHPFVKAVNSVFKSNRWEQLSASRLYDELSERPNFGLIPGVGSVADLATSLSSYKDYFLYDDSTNTYKAAKPEASKPEVSAGVQGLYTVRSNNGGVTA